MAAARSSSRRGLDGEFLSIDQTVPEFGGLFRDDDGTLTVLLRGARAEARARAAVQGFARRNGGDGEELVRFGKAKYPFRRLAQWKDAALVVLGEVGGVFVDVDEMRNRLSVGIVSEEVRPAIVTRLRGLRIPEEALEIAVAERPSPAVAQLPDLLTTDHTPTVGGQRIFDLTRQVYCTLGLNVNHAGARRALTNSHCTDVQGGVENSRFSFNSVVSWFAIEVLDPVYFSCSTSAKCRRADVAVIDYNNGSDMTYKIARTVDEGTTARASLFIGARLPVTGRRNSPLLNDIVKKTGSSSGTTRGRVSQTCAALRLGDVTILCSSRMDAYSALGDSGGPVWYDNGTSATAAGIMFATQSSPVGTYFNDLSAITNDVGSFYVTGDNGPN